MRDLCLVDIHFHTNDSFDAYKNEDFDATKMAEVMSSDNLDDCVRLVCKTDHNYFNYTNYEDMKDKFKIKGINVLPGIEINGDGNIHWIFIFDDTIVDQQLPATDDYKGKKLDESIKEFFLYDLSKDIIKQAEQKQKENFSIIKFVKMLHSIGVPYLAIPHFNKTKGWFQQFKRDANQQKIIDDYLVSNIINGFESKNQDDFIADNIKQTERKIKEIEDVIDNINSAPMEKNKEHYQSELSKRLDHLSKMCELNKSFANNDISMIHGSDFHCKPGETFDSYDKKKLFYMRAENTFEGLRMSLLDPYSRIFSLNRKEKLNKDTVKNIKEIYMNINNENKVLCLGDGLNSIIGSRGSGKSYLLSLLMGDVSSYSGNIKEQVKLLKIVYADGDEKKFLESGDIDFLAQRNGGRVGATENNIYNLLAKAPYDQNAYLEQIESLKNKSIAEVDEIEAAFLKINTLIEYYDKISKSILNDINFEYAEQYNEYFNQMSENFIVSNAASSATSILEKYRDEKKLELANVDTALASAIKLNEMLVAFKETEVYKEDVLYVSKIVDKLNRHKKEIKETLVRTKRIMRICSIILNNLKKESSTKENFLTNKLQETRNFICANLKLIRETFSLNKEVDNILKSKLSKSKIYTINVGYKEYKVKQIAEIDLKNLNSVQIYEIFDKYNSIGEVAGDYLAKVFDVCNYGDMYSKLNKDKRSSRHALNIPTLEYDLYLDIGDGEFVNWKNLSPGERSDKLLDIVLNGESEKILVIDQPEDDLDNETIYKTMVEKIRTLKLKRQLIVVTHNANVAITADSDKIIVCQLNLDKYDYNCESLESKKPYDYNSINSELKNEKIINIAAMVLDGGKEALRKRVKKIGYKDIFYKEEI